MSAAPAPLPSRGPRRGVAAEGERGAPGDFFTRVHDLVRSVPRGRVATYGQLAALLGRPRAARTVGWALSALPDGTDVPWHRVINAAGRISARAPAGARLQAELLRRERVRVGPSGDVDLARHLWRPSRASLRPGRPVTSAP